MRIQLLVRFKSIAAFFMQPCTQSITQTIVIKDILNTYETGLLLWIENNSGVMRIIMQELQTKVQAKHGHYLIILDLNKSKEYTAIIKFIKPKTPIILKGVTKISSCRVHAISGRGIVQARKFFWFYSRLSLNGHLYKMDTPVKRTPRVGPCLCLFPFFSLYKTNISLRWTLSTGPKGVRLEES